MCMDSLLMSSKWNPPILNFGITFLLLVVNCGIHCLFADLQRLISKLDKRLEKETPGTPGRFKSLPRISKEPAESIPPLNAPSWTVSPSHCVEMSTTPVRKPLSAKSIQRSLMESFDEPQLSYDDASSTSDFESDEFEIDH